MKNKNMIISTLKLTIMVCFLISSNSCQAGVTTITMGNGSGLPGTQNSQVEISLQNPNDKSKGMQVDVCDVDDYLSCTVCETTGRASEFTCSFNELENGCVRIILFSFGDLIDEGTGAILNLTYKVSEEAPAGECRNLNLENIQVTDENNNPLEPTVIQGKFCFRSNLCALEELYGEESDEVHLLKKYRGNILSKTPEGQKIISLYYQWNPVITKTIEEDEDFKRELNATIDGILPWIREEVE